MRRQIVVRLRMPVRRMTSWQVSNSVFGTTDSFVSRFCHRSRVPPRRWVVLQIAVADRAIRRSTQRHQASVTRARLCESHSCRKEQKENVCRSALAGGQRWIAMDSAGLKEFFPLVSALGQCRSESTVLVHRKTDFRANRSLSRYDKQTRFRFAL